MEFSLDREVLGVAPAAVETVQEQICLRFPDLESRFGAMAKERCREDIAHHLEYLAAAVGVGDVTPFIDYLHWLASVLTARNLPLDCVKVSLELLAEFFAARSGEAFTAARRILLAGRDALDDHLPQGAPAVAPAPPSPQAARLSQTLLAGDRVAAWGVVSEVCANCGVAELGARLIQPALYDIGALWQANRVSVAQEHLASAITQFLLAQALTRADFEAPIGRKALFANVETNHHAIGLRIIADVFETAGWEVQYLGANVPTGALVAQVAAWRPELVGLSVSLPQQFAHVRGAIGALRAEFGGAAPTVLLGGLAVNRFARVAATMGADLVVADALAADTLAHSP